MSGTEFLAFLTGLNPVWILAALGVAYLIRGYFAKGKVDTDAPVAAIEEALDPTHPLKARLKEKVGDTFDERVEAGEDDADVYKEILDAVRRVGAEGKGEK